MAETTPTPDLNRLAETTYEAYSVAMGGRDPSGLPLAPYADLNVTQQEAWKQAGLAAVGYAQAQAPSQPPSQPPPASGPPAPAAASAEEDEDAHRTGRRR